MIDFTQSVESKEDEWSRFNEEEVLTLKKMARATGLDDPGFILFEVLVLRLQHAQEEDQGGLDHHNLVRKPSLSTMTTARTGTSRWASTSATPRSR